MNAPQASLPFSHCHKCGGAYGAGSDSFPKTCSSCSHTHYRNPIMVSVGMIPCEDGLLGVIRGIEPQKDKEALPGGFVDMETPEEGCSREALEETGVVVDPSSWRYQSSYLTPTGNLLMFFLADIEPIAMPPFPPPPIPGVPMETAGFTIVRPGCELAFASHSKAAEKALELLAQKAPRPRAPRV
jgi:hypothetical protein